MKQKIILKIFPLTVWLTTFTFIFLIQVKSGQLNETTAYKISESVITGLWLISNFYLFYTFLLPEFFFRKRFKLFTFFTLGFIILSPLFVDFALKINKSLNSFPVSAGITLWGLLGGLFGALISGGSGVLFRLIINWFTDSQKRSELEYKNLESELKLLKARLNPHFLFNTINNIDTLISEKPEIASSLLSKLSDLLRYVLYETENDMTDLENEIRVIEQYIELQKIRISNPGNITLNIDCQNPGCRIPPMLFLPFIENAFKHSDLNKQDQYINIELSYTGGEVRFNCKNDIASSGNHEGIGLDLVRRRLELYFSDAFNLKINKSDHIYEVSLIINIK